MNVVLFRKQFSGSQTCNQSLFVLGAQLRTLRNGKIKTTFKSTSQLLIGGFVGFCFAVVTLSISVMSFPLMLDRDVGAASDEPRRLPLIERISLPGCSTGQTMRNGAWCRAAIRTRIRTSTDDGAPVRH